MSNPSPVHIIDPLSFPGYEELLLATPGASFFHSAAWARVLCESYGFRPRYLAGAEAGSFGALMPIMEVGHALLGKKGVCLPFSDECPPLVNGGSCGEGLLQSLLSSGQDLGWRSVEWRGGAGLWQKAIPSLSYLGHRVELGMGEENLFRSFRESTRRNVAKAFKQGVEARVETSAQSVRMFYGLQCLTRKKHGLPPQPLRFFMKLWEHVLCEGKGFVVLAYHRGHAVSGAVFLHHNSRGVFKYGASARAAEPLRANNLVMWEGMRECIRRGCGSLSLGRTEPGNLGLLQFKRGWGGVEEPVNYYKYDLRRKSFARVKPRESGWQTALIARFPVPVLRLLGTLLYPHMA